MKPLEGLLATTCDEIASVAHLMRSAPDIPRALFYYSAVYGALDRHIKLDFDPDIFAAAFVTQTTYNVLVAQSNINRSGDTTVLLLPEHINKLASSVEALAKKLRANGDVFPALKAIMMIAFAASGPGSYLVERGRMTLDVPARS